MTQTYAVRGAGFAKSLLLCVMMATLVLGASAYAPAPSPPSGERTQIAECGGCTFWLEGAPSVDATLSKTGSCAQTCNTTLVLKVKGIVNIAEETFHDMPKLKELTLEENSLARLPADIFKKNTELETLYLRNNQLRAIPADIFRYNTKLVKLYLEHNAITKIEAETFQNNTKLELLILSNNRLTRIDSNTFKTNLELRELHLAGNAITSLEADTFKYNIKLEALAMGPNPLGCVVRPASVIHFGTEPLPECPDNCTVNTYYDADANVCLACPDGTFTDGVGAVCCGPSGDCKDVAPALDTCAGARAKWDGLHRTVCHPGNDGKHTQGSCGSSTECKDYISSMNDDGLALLKRGLQACAKAGMEEAAIFAVRVFWTINQISDGCGFPAGTVTASGPGLHTCEGAAVKWTQLWPDKPEAGVCPTREKDDGSGDREHSRATCNTTECEAAIRSITDEEMACWKNGLQV